MRPRAAAAALVEKDDTVDVGIEKLPVIRFATRARTTMQEHHGYAILPAAFLDMQRMSAGYRQGMRYVWLDWWEQLEHVFTRRIKGCLKQEGRAVARPS
jgi:hypothetical protein